MRASDSALSAGTILFQKDGSMPAGAPPLGTGRSNEVASDSCSAMGSAPCGAFPPPDAGREAGTAGALGALCLDVDTGLVASGAAGLADGAALGVSAGAP